METYTDEQLFSMQSSVFAVVLIIFKLFIVVNVQGYLKFVVGARAPEDTKLFKEKGEQDFTPKEDADPAMVDKHRRWERILGNDMENNPIGLAAILLFLTPNVDGWTHGVLAIVFVASRYLHMIMFALALQPWRTLFWTLGFAATMGMGFNALNGVMKL